MRKFLRGSSQHSHHPDKGGDRSRLSEGARLCVRSQRQALKYARNKTRALGIRNPHPL